MKTRVSLNTNGNLMKAMLKSELARMAGVSRNTLMNWCKPFQGELEGMGIGPKAKMLPPHVVKFIAEKLCIEL